MVDEQRRRVLHLDDSTSVEGVERIAKGLASDNRLQILKLLGQRVHSVNEIAEALDMPGSTATLHVNVLERAGLIESDLVPARRGLQKVCSRKYDRVIFDLAGPLGERHSAIEVSMPLGSYTDCRVTPNCGLAGALGIIGLLDDPASFYEPDHIYAELVWFRTGYLEYRFPNRLPPHSKLGSVHLSMEICSAAPLHSDDWPSDVTLWMNGQEVGTWTCPADFGGHRGALTPGWWEDNNSQYGLLKVWKVTRDGTYVDGVRISDVTCAALKCEKQPFIAVRIGVKPDAQHVGGLNLFGSKFGNYPQNLIMTLNHEPVETHVGER